MKILSMNKLYASLLFLITFFLCSNLLAQSSDKDKILFLDAEYFLMTEDYKEALSTYLQLYRTYPENANINYRIGLCLLNIEGQKTRSIPYLEKAALSISEKYTESHFSENMAPPQTLFLLGTAYQINNDLDMAINTFAEYKSYLDIKDVYEIDFVDKQIYSCEIAKSYLKQAANVRYNSLDSIIPGDYPNFNPVMSGNQKVLIFMTEEKFYKAVWMSQNVEGKWTKAVNITSQIKSDGDLYPCSITKDGKILYLVMMSSFEGDIMVSNFINGEWSPAKKLEKPVNTRNWETHAGISSDGKTLYFTSNRKGGFGGQDIYKTTMNEKGKWETPVNLGPTINTAYNEATPFILGDNKTLYFGSQGHEGMGGFDTYKASLLEDGSWSVPVNLGYPLNTTDDNTFFYPLDDGNSALYSGIMNKTELKSNIKKLLLLPEELRTDRKITLNGSFSFQDNDIPDEIVNISIQKENGESLDSELHYKQLSQTFSISLEPGNYRLTASLENYESKNERINIDPGFNRDEIKLNIEFIPKEVSSGEYIVIKNILFDYDRSELTTKAKLDLERLHSVMLKYPSLFIEVVGHTDSRGNPDYNFELSRKRASSVIQYLTEKGIDPARFVSISAGETNNIAVNMNPDGSDSPEGRSRNRNVIIKIPQSGNYNIIVEPIPVPDHLKPVNAKKYTILLASSDKPIENRLFNRINEISAEGVREFYSNNIYQYTLGNFYSKTQAEELLQSKFLSGYRGARVIELENEIRPEGLISSLSNSESEAYSIQIAALKNAENTLKFNKKEEFRIVKGNDGIYRVLAGGFSNRLDAMEVLPYIRSQGYDDAFVIDLDVFEKSVASLDQKSKELYVIQIKALNIPLGRDYFKDLYDVRVIEGPDKIYRYIYGDFESLQNAKKELARIKNWAIMMLL